MNTIRSIISRLLAPDRSIGGTDNPYLLRWYLIPRNRWFNIYLHKFMRDDEDRALHDHPWSSVSFLFKGQYIEVTEAGEKLYYAPCIIRRGPDYKHRVIISSLGGQKPWTLFVTGPKVREWGFWCPQGFVPWQEFTKSGSSDEVGKGCGEP